MAKGDLNIYQKVTDRIIEQLEKGVIPWRKPWKVSGVQIRFKEDLTKLAFNRVTKLAYGALNQMLLSQVGEYASFKQWTDLGGKIKKGAKSEIVVFWKWLDYKDENNVDENGNPKIKRVPYLKQYQVFHISDVEGVEPLVLEELNEGEEKPEPDCFSSIEEAERIMNEYQTRESMPIEYRGNEAYYAPALDRVTLPERFKFGKNTAEFYSTAFHELTHSTGAKHRLDRQIRNHFGDSNYSKEELVAEIGASGMLNLLNIETPDSFTNSVAYIQSWIAQLKKDNKLIVTASAQAEKAIRYILNGKESEAA